MKKLVVFHPSVELYGADRIMINAVKALNEYEPTIYLPKEGPLINYIRKILPEAKVIILPELPIIYRSLFTPKGVILFSKNMIHFRKRMRREFREIRFDLIYINTLACSFLLPILSKFNIPIITHVHEILEKPKVIARATTQLAFKYSDSVISVSNAVESNLLKNYSKNHSKSRIVHNGILPIKGKSKKENQKLKFYLFGRIKPGKGQWYLLDAIAKIPKRELENIEFIFVGGTIVGKEYLKDNLRKKIKTLDLESSVLIKDFTNDISSEMLQADVCLIPSLMKDPFPTTVLEAMSAGKAVIASDTGGAKEAIDDNKSGFIIPSDNPIQFASIIRKFILNLKLAETMGEKAKEVFNAKFTLNHFNRNWSNAIADIH